MKIQIAIFALVASPIAAAAPAMAQQDGMFERSSQIVRYDDLDLANARGRERLGTRLRQAANSACGVRSARTLSERQAADQCRDQAMAKAADKAEEAARQAKNRRAN